MCFSLLGCASPEVKEDRPTYLAPSERERLGTIGIVSVSAAKQFEWDLPESAGRAARKSLEAGAAGPVAAGAVAASDLDKLAELDSGLLVVAAVAGVAVGSVAIAQGTYGVLTGESTAKIRAATPAMTNALGAVRFDDALRYRLRQCIQSQTAHPVRLVSVAGLAPANAGRTLKERYASLVPEGITSVIELKWNAALDGERRFALQADVWFKVVDVASGRIRYAGYVPYESGRRKFTEWAKDNAEPFRTELERCYSKITDTIMDRLFR